MAEMTCLTTNPQPGNDRFRRALEQTGMEVLQLPLHHIAAPSDGGARLRAVIATLQRRDWLLFSTPRSVQVFTETLQEHGSTPPPHVTIAAVGGATASCLQQSGMVPDVVGDGSGRSMAKALVARGVAGMRCYSLQAEGGRTDWHARLLNAGATVTMVATHRLVPTPLNVASCCMTYPIAAVPFTAPSAVERFHDLFGAVLHRAPFVGARFFAIGETTAIAVRTRKLPLAGISPRANFQDYACFIGTTLSIV
ncbi:MAG: uroporphyrinogen-III synthase [Deltaproteobacteria bacterium]|nr:uroporphyrinogen-III synthase [Deltaproteobacteria bacterium]